MRRSYPTRSPPVVRAPGCWSTAGASFMRPAPWRSVPGGEKSAGTKGAQEPMSWTANVPHDTFVL